MFGTFQKACGSRKKTVQGGKEMTATQAKVTGAGKAKAETAAASLT